MNEDACTLEYCKRRDDLIMLIIHLLIALRDDMTVHAYMFLNFL
jgi:hypothetical protein